MPKPDNKTTKKSQFLEWTSIKKTLNKILANFNSVSSAAQSCPALCDPMDWSMPGFPVHHQLLELAQTHVHPVGDAIQPSHLCHPVLLLLSILPSIRVFSNESVLHIRWPMYWSFSFSISPSSEYAGLISSVAPLPKTLCNKLPPEP